MAILSNGKFYGFLCSVKETGRKLANGVKEYVEDFVSGFAGHGWRLWEYVTGKWMLEIDSIRIREQFIVFEMLVSKMRAIIGSLGISQACGKIATVTLSEDGTEYLITLEDETMSFVAHDFMRCQTYTGTKQMFYHVEISAVVDDVIHVPVSEFNIDAEGVVINPPEPGNDIVQFGNSQDKTRQSAIYIHADKSGQPAIDIMFDIDSKDWTGKIKTRLGGDLPGEDGVRGFYCENGMIKGVDASGHTVYCIYPSGTAEFGDGSAKFNTDRSGKLAGGAISWKWDAAKGKYICTMGDVILSWDNLGDDVKENLKVIGIQDADVEYAQCDSSSVEPIDGWQTTSPAWANGKYIWSRTKITFTDGTINYTKAACISGGKGIASIVEQYYLSSSSSSLSDGSWSVDRPAWKNGWYIWTRSVITFTDGSSTITEAICVTGEKGEDGKDGANGANGADGVDGTDGTSIIWQGSFSSHPANPQNGWAYKNTTDGKSYVYQSGSWYQMTVDGVDGANGKDGNDGLDIVWKGDSSTPPANPQKNWVYRDTDNGRVYIYNGLAWELMVADGNDGIDGTDGAPGSDGKDGMGVFITYHDGVAEPAMPTGDGTTGGWHTNATSSVIWMSQKVSESADTGSWGSPIKIKGNDGLPGSDADVPDWVKEWDTGKVLIGDKYMISPMLFTGKNTGTAAEPMLTGILQGDKCITIDGVERSGIFALVDNEIVFSLDPINKKYLFKGEFMMDSGYVNNQIFNNYKFVSISSNYDDSYQMTTGEDAYIYVVSTDKKVTGRAAILSVFIPKLQGDIYNAGFYGNLRIVNGSNDIFMVTLSEESYSNYFYFPAIENTSSSDLESSYFTHKDISIVLLPGGVLDTICFVPESAYFPDFKYIVQNISAFEFKIPILPELGTYPKLHSKPIKVFGEIY